MPTHESEQRRRLSLPVARAAPPALPRPFPQPDPSPQSPSSVTSLCLSSILRQRLVFHVYSQCMKSEDQSTRPPRGLTAFGVFLLWGAAMAPLALQDTHCNL